MMHSTYLKLFTFLTIALFSLPNCLNAQLVKQGSKESKLALRLNLSFPTHYNANETDNSFQNDLERNLFSDNLIFGLEADYFVNSNWAITPAVSFTLSETERDNGLVFVFPPPPDAITNFRTDYRFFSVSLDPKIKLFLPYSNFGFFWTAGPIISYGSLSSETDGAPHRDQDNFSSFASSSSRSAGFGFTVLTGLQVPLSSTFLLSIEAGYRFLDFSAFSLENPIHSGESNSINYRLNSFTPSVGIVYKL